mmetsp:Transcript_41293/g.54284  ORF Transcript_41293/g.54284 Transcript_41293/m.54284 type:complete len:191 (+) Transcript_41293:77-649(+)
MDRGRRAMPVGNKICNNRAVKQAQEKHRKKLAEMKCRVDNKPPDRPSHLRRNLKKEQLMEDRFATIERDNRILLEKMSYIMRRNQFDNVNQSTQYAHSLNKEARKRDLQRITRENQGILRRIQQAEPHYDHLKWEDEARKVEQYKNNICEYAPLDNDYDRGQRSSSSRSILASAAANQYGAPIYAEEDEM